MAKTPARDAAGQVIVDLDGVLVLAHSEMQDATATWKKTFGHHPLMGFVDHGGDGSSEPLPGLLRPGNAGSNTAADHITTTQLALAQLPKKYRRGRQTLIRTDSGGGTGPRPPPGTPRRSVARIGYRACRSRGDLRCGTPAAFASRHRGSVAHAAKCRRLAARDSGHDA
jgi:Transposase DDE domain group 1